MMRWDYRPSFLLGKKGPPKINAKAENLVQSSLWEPALRSRRCIIPADGFYEWRTVPGQKSKQPMHIRKKGGEPFAFAGLYVFDRDRQPSCAIVTTRPNELVAPIHDRMPVILDQEAEARWLDREVDDAAFLLSLLEPYQAEAMEAYPVVSLVGNVKNDSPGLLERA
jgi:putative SOS response-associated peptidase YedK